MKTSPTVLFFGNERLATGVATTAPTLRALIDNGFTIAALVLNNEAAVSRKNRTPEIVEVANQHNIPILYGASVDELKTYQADVAVLVAYGKIVPQAVIDVFPAGIVNIHPSALPKHRGSIPIESIMLSGDTETAVSLMKLVKQMDAGPVYAQRTISVPSSINKQDLADLLLKNGSELVVQHLQAIVDNTLTPTPQDESQATYDSLIQKSDGIIDWTKPATRLEREIRAYALWPKTKAAIGNHQVIITEAVVVNTSGEPGNYVSDKNSLIVHCGLDSLKITRLQPENKKEMPVEAFLLGYSL